jgi:hypothetical protein
MRTDTLPDSSGRVFNLHFCFQLFFPLLMLWKEVALLCADPNTLISHILQAQVLFGEKRIYVASVSELIHINYCA